MFIILDDDVDDVVRRYEKHDKNKQIGQEQSRLYMIDVYEEGVLLVMMIICFDKYLRSFSNILRLLYDGFGYPPTNWGLELQNIGFCDADDSDGDSGEYDSDGDSDDGDSDGHDAER